MSKYNRFKITSSTGISSTIQIGVVQRITDLCKHGVTLSLTAWIIVGRATAQTRDAARCNGSSVPAVDDLGLFLNNLHGIAVEVAIPLAGVMYAWAGLNWMTGVPENQRKARNYFAATTIGLIIVLLSKGFVPVVTGPFCGGGA